MISRIAGTVGTLISDETERTAGSATSKTSVLFSRVRSTRTVSPFGWMEVTLFKVGQSSNVPSWIPVT